MHLMTLFLSIITMYWIMKFVLLVLMKILPPLMTKNFKHIIPLLLMVLLGTKVIKEL